MALSPNLHPSIKEREEPSISATALAEYLILQADGQLKILQNSRYISRSIVGANGDAMRALRRYNADPRRDRSQLDTVKTTLTMRALDQSERPKRRDEARRCAEAINLFERHENRFGMRSMSLRRPPRLDSLTIEGVNLSITPDFLVDGDRGRLGAALLRVAKAPDPEDCRTDETRQRRGDHRREMARYMVAILQMLLEAQEGRLGIPDRDLCFVADIRLGEKIGAAPDHAVRLRDIRGACAQIAALWPSINPRPSMFKKN
jgi:hypothetical protein